MDMSTLQAQQTLFVKQKFTFMVNRYEVWTADPAGNPQSMICFAQQKRMAMKEQVSLFTDESKRTCWPRSRPARSSTSAAPTT